jgi:hypothetical protein
MLASSCNHTAIGLLPNGLTPMSLLAFPLTGMLCVSQFGSLMQPHRDRPTPEWLDTNVFASIPAHGDAMRVPVWFPVWFLHFNPDACASRLTCDLPIGTFKMGMQCVSQFCSFLFLFLRANLIGVKLSFLAHSDQEVAEPKTAKIRVDRKRNHGYLALLPPHASSHAEVTSGPSNAPHR